MTLREGFLERSRQPKLGVSALSSPRGKNIPVPFLFETPYNAFRLIPHEGRIAIVTDAG
jgi:hypothetical protein